MGVGRGILPARRGKFMTMAENCLWEHYLLVGEKYKVWENIGCGKGRTVCSWGGKCMAVGKNCVWGARTVCLCREIACFSKTAYWYGRPVREYCVVVGRKSCVLF